MTKRRTLLAMIYSLLLVVAVFFVSWFHFIYSSSINSANGVSYTVREGASFDSVVTDLAHQNIIGNAHYFKVLVLLHGDLHKLKAGEYLFLPGATPTKILSQIVSGTGLVMHSVTIVSGWTFKQVREAINTESSLRHKTKDLSDTDLMKLLGQADLNPEGQFYPETYLFTRGTPDTKIYKIAFKAMQDKTAVAWQARDIKVPYRTMNEALIAASLIEKEARYDTERSTISGVIINRLKKNMLLQIDPTVIYGLGDRYKGAIYKSDLIENTPYNTYVHKGLPPTPIAMPGLASINAALHPEVNDYLYYVARGDGYHQFSKTLEEHNKAVTEARKVHAAFYNHELIKRYVLLPSPRVFFTNGRRVGDEGPSPAT